MHSVNYSFLWGGLSNIRNFLLIDSEGNLKDSFARKEHKNVLILYSKVLKAKEQVKSQDKDKKPILGQIKSFKADGRSNSNKKDHSKGTER